MPTVQVKYSNQDKRQSWKTFPLDALSDELKNVDRDGLINGTKALYIHGRVCLSDDKFTYWICLDVESPENHESIQANIEVARDLLLFLSEKELLRGLVIILSGSGFRFVWPWVIPPEYKRAFSSWIQSMACIDSSVNLGNKFVRMAGYRGNPKQGKDLMDVHLQPLPNINDLFSIDESDYLKRIHGKPDFEQYLSWLPLILPKQVWLPPEWETFLQEHKVNDDIRRSIWTPEYLPDPVSFDHAAMWKQIHAELDRMGISYTERQYGDISVTRLSSCPICGKKEGYPYITERGRLKDRRATCEAGQSSDDGYLKGVLPHAWIDGYEAVYSETGPGSHDDDGGCYSTLDDLRETLNRGLQETKKNLLVRVPPGVGKTTTALKHHCKRGLDKQILYLAPTHKLGDEVFQRLPEFTDGLPVNIYRIHGRNEDNCQRIEKVKKVIDKGYSPFMMHCFFCQKDLAKKELKCAYLEQFKAMHEPGFGVAVHHQIAGIDLNSYGFDTVIIDENPLKAFYETRSVSFETIESLSGGYQGDFFQELYRVINRYYSVPLPQDRKFGAQVRIYIQEPPPNSKWSDSPQIWDFPELTAEKERLSTHLSSYARLKDESVIKWSWRLFKWDINFHALKWLWCALGEESGHGYIRINIKPDDEESERQIYRFVRTAKNLPDFSGQIIAIDGTGNEPEYTSLFEKEFETISGKLKPTCQKTLVRQNFNKSKLKNMIESNQYGTLNNLIKRVATSAIKNLRPKDQKILIATHQLVEGLTLEVCQSLLPDRHFEAIHFYGPRGINRYENYDAVICFGTPKTNQAERLDEAMMLFPGDHEEHLKWFERQWKAELIQTVERLRLAQGDKNLILVDRKWVPELGRLEGEIDLRKGSDKINHSTEKAYERVKRFYKVYGFCTIKTLIALGIGHISQKQLLEKVIVKSSVHLSKYIILGERSSKTRPFKVEKTPKVFLFSHKNTASDLIERLKSEFIGQEYEYLIRSYKSAQWTKAYGSLNAAKEFHRIWSINNFNPDEWRKVYNETE
ncbi:MAG: DEAD/DEAH box helicase family protein [Desulfamplus sp.]|nr:DEAD/DEAH box helicase family protein [Desulfamplus sp.]